MKHTLHALQGMDSQYLVANMSKIQGLKSQLHQLEHGSELGHPSTDTIVKETLFA